MTYSIQVDGARGDWNVVRWLDAKGVDVEVIETFPRGKEGQRQAQQLIKELQSAGRPQEFDPIPSTPTRRSRMATAAEEKAALAERGLRHCIGSERYGIAPHDEPIENFPAQPSQPDGIGRMCKPHWNEYTRGLARDRKAAKGESANGSAPAKGTKKAAAEAAKAKVRADAKKPKTPKNKPSTDGYSIDAGTVPPADEPEDALLDSELESELEAEGELEAQEA